MAYICPWHVSNSSASDPRRKVYDQTGSLADSEELAGEQFSSLYEYYRNIYKKVTEDDIYEAEAEYRGSEEEKNDLLELYKRFKGNMDTVSALHHHSLSLLCYCLSSIGFSLT